MTNSRAEISVQFPFFALFSMSVVTNAVAKVLGIQVDQREGPSYSEPCGLAHTYEVWFRLEGERRFGLLLVLRDDGTASCVPDGFFDDDELDIPAPWKACIVDELIAEIDKTPDPDGVLDDILRDLIFTHERLTRPVEGLVS